MSKQTQNLHTGRDIIMEHSEQYIDTYEVLKTFGFDKTGTEI
jgi:hypothetical protein